MKKLSWTSDIWETVLLLTLIQSLIVPWDPLYNLPRPPELSNRISELEGGNFDFSADYNGVGQAPRGKVDGYDPLSPVWRDTTIANIVRAIYPTDGLLVRVLTDVLTTSPTQGAMLPRGLPPSHPEGASSSFLDEAHAAASALEESLSLEDSDLIDVLWRHDIEQEKGSFPFPFDPSPDLQHDEDVQVLTEKHMTQAIGWNNGEHQQLYNRLSRAYEELKASQKDYHSVDPFQGASPTLQTKSYELEGLRTQEKEGEPFSPTQFLHSKEKTEVAAEAFPPEASDLSWKDELLAGDEFPDFLPLGEEDGTLEEMLRLEAFDTQPTNDVCLASACAHLNDSTLLSPDQDVTPDETNTRAERVLPLRLDCANDMELDEIPTPSLELSPSDLSRIFTDQQVTADVASASSSFLMDQAVGYSDLGNEGVPRSRVRQSVSPFYDQSVPNSAIGSLEDADAGVLEFFPMMELLDHSELIPRKDLPATSPRSSPRLLSPARPQAPPTEMSPSSSSHVDHDHMYWSASPEETATSLSLMDPNEDSHRGERLVGKLMPKLEEGETEDEGMDDTMSETSTEIGSSSRQEERRTGRKSQDQELASRYNLPVTAEQISAMPLQEFQNLTKAQYLTSEQIEIIKKIRRRGKNKLAARNCRKRKVNNLDQLGVETSLLNQEFAHESAANRDLLQQISAEQAEIERLEKELETHNGLAQ